MGYVVAVAGIIDRLAKIRLLVDRQGDHIMDNTIANLLEDETLKRYIRKSLQTYRQRRDVFCTLLQTELSRWITELEKSVLIMKEAIEKQMA